MPVAFQQITFAPNTSQSDIFDQIKKAIDEIPKAKFNARPLPQNPKILTFAHSPIFQDDAELWENTCPVCRPLVRDLKVFCMPQNMQSTFQAQNTFIVWNVVFFEMASALKKSIPDVESANDGKRDGKDVEDEPQEKEKLDGSDRRQNSLEEPGPEEIESKSSDSAPTEHQTGNPKVDQCGFCAYFACLMFDDAGYTFLETGEGIGHFEIGCCCMASMEESTRIAKVSKKLSGYAEKFGQDTYLNFIIQPIDYDLEHNGFGKLRFQAYSRSANISDQDILNILGLRRELVLEVYGIPGRMSGDLSSIKYWPISTEPESWKKAGAAWMSRCISSHEHCRPPVKVPLPSRVVEILDDNSVRVIAGADRPDDFYITLSYCWGAPQEFALTTNTMEDKHRGFDVSYLPATLRDAVSVTKTLGIKYIWIDSLCIIQDSTDDKNRELPRMAEYYRCSFLTISASTRHCSTSFLSSRGRCEKHPEIRLPKDLAPLGLLISAQYEVGKQEEGGDDVAGTQFMKHAVDYVLVRKELPYSLSSEPIYSRGWTFQERVLSPRNLLFGERVIWQCHTHQDSLGGVTSWDDDAQNVDHRTIGRVFFDSQYRTGWGEALIGADSKGKEQYNIWYKAVEEYTCRELSVSSDKLPAISALAQVFQDLTGDDYLAGIWRGDLLRGLMWSTYPTLAVSKPSSWRAPSWSWAAHDNEVSYKGIPPPIAVPVARVLASKAIPLSKTTPLGEVGSGILEIEGPVIELDKDVTIFLMQKENDLPRIADTVEYRKQAMSTMSSKNMRTDPGCQSWQPPDGHIFLVLLATPVKVQSNTASDSSSASKTSKARDSELGTEFLRETIKDESGTRNGESTTVIEEKSPTEFATASLTPTTIEEADGYSLSGLVLGPVPNAKEHGKPKYERLARFTSIGAMFQEYRDLTKLTRKVIIV